MIWHHAALVQLCFCVSCIFKRKLKLSFSNVTCFPFASSVPASNPEISAQIDYKLEKSMVTTISCLSPKGSLPINYTLYRDTTLVNTLVAESRRRAEFLVNLSFSELLETLKCKADNGFGPKYSRGLIIGMNIDSLIIIFSISVFTLK